MHGGGQLFLVGLNSRFQLLGRMNFFKYFLFLGQAQSQGFSAKIFNKGNNTLNFLVRGQNCLQNSFLRDFGCAGLHHHNSFLGAGHGNVHYAVGFLLHGGVDDELTVYHTHNNTGNRPVERRVGDVQSRRSAAHSGDFRRAIVVHGKDGGHHLHILAISLGEQGPQGPVNQARVQNGLVAGASLAADEAAWDTPHSIHFFFVIHC